MTISTNDKGESVMVPDSGLDRVKVLWPATIETIKSSIKHDGVLKTIDRIKKYEMVPVEKSAILFIASGFRLTRKF